MEKNGANLSKFFIGLEILDFDSGAAIEYGRIRATLRKKGTPIGQMDMLIAAHAKSKGLTLVTNNVSEFERVDGLKLEDWLAA
jgi:tRNA(fMet)-specific endonuclease VapC